MNRFKSTVFSILFVVTAFLCSCSGDSYLNAIPSSSTALISMDMTALAENSQSADKGAILKNMLGVDNVSDCGIDLSSKIYLFETADGNLGLCAKVSSESDLEDMFDNLSSQGKCEKVSTRRGYHFTVLKDVWLAGFSDEALVVMGPVVKTAQAEVQQKITRYLGADEESGITSSPLFGRLDTISSPMALVAQAQALPEQFVAPFTLGAPKDSDPSQVLIAAEMSVDHGKLKLNGETFSFNKRVDESLKKASAIYRPIKGKYVQSMSSESTVGMFLNVDGNQFLPLMQSNKGLQMLLAGINTAIDMDNIMRSVNGDMAIIMPSMDGKGTQMMMSAQLAHSKWLDDIDYWKKSCPSGSRIVDWGKNAYCFTDSKTSYYFGVSPDLQYYSGSSADMAQNSIKASAKPMQSDLQKEVIGKKLVMIVNIGGTGKDQNAVSAFSSLLEPLFGKLNSIVYSLK